MARGVAPSIIHLNKSSDGHVVCHDDGDRFVSSVAAAVDACAEAQAATALGDRLRAAVDAAIAKVAAWCIAHDESTGAHIALAGFPGLKFLLIIVTAGNEFSEEIDDAIPDLDWALFDLFSGLPIRAEIKVVPEGMAYAIESFLEPASFGDTDGDENGTSHSEGSP